MISAYDRIKDAYSDEPERRGAPAGDPAAGYRMPFETKAEWTERSAPYLHSIGAFIGDRGQKALMKMQEMRRDARTKLERAKKLQALGLQQQDNL